MSTLHPSLDLLALFAKAGVAVVLVLSGYAKVAGPPSSARHGLPTMLVWLDRTAGRLVLGSVELGLGAASLLALASPVVDALVLMLCAAFFLGSAVFAITSPGTACQCFGAASKASFGLRHSVLTGGLAAAATGAFVGSLAGAGSAAWSWHPLMLVTLSGVLLVASRIRPVPDLRRGVA